MTWRGVLFLFLNMSLTTTLQLRAKLTHHNLCRIWILFYEKPSTGETWRETNLRKLKILLGGKQTSKKCRHKNSKNILCVNILKRDEIKIIWKAISPLFPDKKFKNGNHIALSENNDIINDQRRVAEMLKEYFSTAAMSVGFEDCVKSATDAINTHSSHPSVIKLQENSNPENSLSSRLVHT